MSIVTHTDQLGRNIKISSTPQRIICLVPSISELLFDLGIGDRLVGTTIFCIHPKSLKSSTTRIGGTKNINLEKIEQLQPDLIIANKEENSQDQVESLASKFPVWISDVSNIYEALVLILLLGSLLDCDEKAIAIHDQIATSFQTLSSSANKSCLYLIWNDPYMAVAKGTFIDDMLARSGFVNVLSNDTRYPELTAKQIKQLDPRYIFLSSEPFPFKEKHLKELSLICPKSKIKLVDGELFSWYGSRLINSVAYFRTL